MKKKMHHPLPLTTHPGLRAPPSPSSAEVTGEKIWCAISMVFTNIYNPRAEIGKMDQLRPTLVKKGATIGANATIVCGTTLGRYCFVGAGALVNKNISDHALVVGNPAKQIGWACDCGERLTDDLECLACEKQYKKSVDGLVWNS